MGHLPTPTPREGPAPVILRHWVVGVDLNRALFGMPGGKAPELSFVGVLLSGRHEQMMIKRKVQRHGMALAAREHR